MIELGNRRVAVVGAGKSGIAAANFCSARGAKVVLTDSKTFSVSVDPSVALELGGHRPETLCAADLIVISPGVPSFPALEDARSKGVPITGEIELASQFIEAPIVAITGTNGKSTVTALAGTIAEKTGRPTFVGGNLGTPLITCVDTPAVRRDGIVVVELSSYQLETCETFHPRAAALLNLAPDHLDRYLDLDAYGAAKLRIARNMTKDDLLVVNGDDSFFDRASRTYESKTRVVRYTMSDRRSPDVVGRNEGGQLSVTTHEGGPWHFPVDQMNLVGRHNVGNALAAILVMSELANFTAIEAGLRSFRALPHRMQLVGERQGIRFYDDSKATNVDSVIAGLDGFPVPYVLIAGGRDKGAPYAPMVDVLRRGRCRGIVLIGEAADKIAQAIGTSFEIRRADSMDSAVRTAARWATGGDAVILSPACASFDMFRNYEHRGQAFVAAVEAIEQ